MTPSIITNVTGNVTSLQIAETDDPVPNNYRYVTGNLPLYKLQELMIPSLQTGSANVTDLYLTGIRNSRKFCIKLILFIIHRVVAFNITPELFSVSILGQPIWCAVSKIWENNLEIF